MPSEIDFRFNKLPKCPHCSTDFAVWDRDNPLKLDYDDGGRTTFQCQSCFKNFVAVTHVEYRFSTAVSEEAVDDDEFGPQRSEAA